MAIDFSQNHKITTIAAVILQTQAENRHVVTNPYRPEHPTNKKSAPRYVQTHRGEQIPRGC